MALKVASLGRIPLPTPAIRNPFVIALKNLPPGEALKVELENSRAATPVERYVSTLVSSARRRHSGEFAGRKFSVRQHPDFPGAAVVYRTR